MVSVRHSAIIIIGCICFPAMIIVSGCAATDVSASPHRLGWAVTTMPGFMISGENSSVHAVLGYHRVNFKGGGGHNNFFQLGSQYRYSLENDAEAGPWFGGEVTYVRIVNKYDGLSETASANAFTLGVIGGYRFNIGKLPLSVYIAPAFMRRGEFKMDDMVVSPSGNGFFGRLGVDLHFMSFLSERGR